MRQIFLFLAATVFSLSLLSCGSSVDSDNPLNPGQTEFTNAEPENGNDGRGGWESPNAMGGEATDGDSKAPAPPGAPQGREGEVEEADIYKVENNKLFYLNTYRGFIIYDIADPQDPKLVSRLPVYGYPIEMFIQDNTVYALIRDALYLTQASGKLQFERHNVSQLLAIDISDLTQPKILQTVDIIGELREGVSRKIEDTIYVVSYISRYYWWGWNYGNSNDQKEQAWVYAFNVADPKNLKLVNQLKIFEGGGYSTSNEGTDNGTGTSSSGNVYESRYFQDVAISATSNALMVVENWQYYGYVQNSPYDCGTSVSQQQAVVSIVDISDPTGKINLHTKFETYGHLSDQFKQTYIFDETTKKGTYLGIFARREWSSFNCSGSSVTKNTLEAWDITDGSNPKVLDALAFGKPDETVRGSVYDPDRRVAFAITAQAIDPLYAISFADPADLQVLSEVDGLSGDMNVFRFIEDRNFLVAIGRDNSSTCTGFGSPTTGWSTNVAVSVIDVQDLANIRLVQRQCVAVKNASWVSSELNWNLDQAHKMIGMHSDGQVNVITVPVYYWKESGSDGWWYSSYETAVGLMTWDLSQYDPSKSHLEQNVLQNFGTIIHPKGQVRRSIVFTHKGSVDTRMVLNLSDTHISVVDINDLNQPKLQSIVEVAPYMSELFRFGSHMVEHIRPEAYYYYYGNSQSMSEFRVKLTSSAPKLEDATVVASFFVGQVERVVPYKDSLILFRRVPVSQSSQKGYYESWQAEALIYDLSNPAAPKKAGSVKLPGMVIPYYWYWCGMDAYWGGYWFDYYGYYGANSWTMTDQGPVFLSYIYDYQNNTASRRLIFLDASNPSQPAVSEQTLTSSDAWEFFGLISDPADPQAFYLSYRTKIGTVTVNGDTFIKYKYYAQRWSLSGSTWKAGAAINMPGRLMKTWSTSNNTRIFLTYDYTYKKITMNQNTPYPYDMWKHTFRLNLLREINPYGQPLAELLDFHSFPSLYLKGVVVEGTKLLVNARPDYYYMETNDMSWDEVSDNLIIFDLSALTMNQVYAEPTGTYEVQMMGFYQGKLFLNLPGDGLLVVDVSNPAQPTGLKFMRTLGWASHLEFSGNSAFVAAGYFGIYQMDLAGPSLLPTS